MDKYDLVSVCVITYNSEKTVLETLDSIREQTYSHIELIISDDCSQDNTVKLCRKWIEGNHERFIDCKVVSTPKNKGVSGNMNNAIQETSGSWVRLIAGDDIMLPHCIKKYMDSLKNYPDTQVFLSRVQSFSQQTDGSKKYNKIPEYSKQIACFNTLDSKSQCRYLLEEGGDMFSAPTVLIKRDILSQYPFNESYRFMEDYPQWVKLTDCGYKIRILDEVTVYYRKANSVSRNRKSYYSSRLMETKNLYFWAEKLELLRKYDCKKGYNENRKLFLATSLVDALTKNKRTPINSVKVKMIALLVNLLKFDL